MQTPLQKMLDGLTGPLAPVRTVVERYARAGFRVQPDGAIAVRKELGPLAHAMWLFPGVPDATIERYRAIHGKLSGRPLVIPETYRAVLRQLNGAHLFDGSLYGLMPAMTKDPPLLDRSGAQPLDLAFANYDLRHAFKAGPELFHFGGGPLSYSEDVGYFLDPKGRVVALRNSGRRHAYWPSFSEFLRSELARWEAEYKP